MTTNVEFEVLVEQLDALCDELAETLPDAASGERWAAVLERLPALRDPTCARAVQTLRFNTALADLICTHLARGEYQRLCNLGMTGIWIADQRYLWPDFAAIPIEPAHASIRAAPSPLDNVLIEPESRLVRAILRVLTADPAGPAFYELAVCWRAVMAGWSRPENTELVSMDRAHLDTVPGDGPYVVVQPNTILGIGRDPLEAAHAANASDGYLFELGARLHHYNGGPLVADEDVFYLARCSFALARRVLVHRRGDIAWCWRDGRLRLPVEAVHYTAQRNRW